MSTSTSTTIISTKKSAVFRAYPWSNGVVLAEDTRAFMEKALEGRGHCEKLVKMALTLASCVDDTVNVQIDDPNTRTFIREFLGPDDSTSSIEEARSSLLTGSRSQRPSNKNLVTAAHIIFRYRLLDIVADVLETPRHADVSLVPKNPAPDFKIDRLTKMFGVLKDWPKLVSNFRKSHDTRIYVPNDQPIPAIASSSSEEQKFFHSGILNMIRAHRSGVGMNYKKVMFNIDILVFCLWWFGAGFLEFPHDGETMLQVLKQRAKDLDVPANFTEVLAGVSGELTDMATAMRNVFHLAVSVSPLLVLYPGKLGSKSSSIRRDYLIGHAIALGNDKPKRLQQTENALWAMLLNMAIGLDQREEMSRFFDKLDEFDLLENEPMEEDWFVKGPGPSTSPTLEQDENSSDNSTQTKEIELPPPTSNDPGPSTLPTPEEDENSQDDSRQTNEIELPPPTSNDPGPSTLSTREEDENSQDDSTTNDRSDGGVSKRETKDRKAKSKAKPQTKPARTPTKRRASRKTKKKSRNIVGNDESKGNETANKNHIQTVEMRSGNQLPFPDLPQLTALMTISNETQPRVSALRSEKKSKEGVKVELYRADRSLDPIRYEFKVSQNTAKVEYTMLAEIQANVKRLFQQDKPLHHLDSARALEYDPKGSVFYVTTTQEFDKLDADQIQEIFRRRHILIPGTPERDVRFDRIGLATLGSFKATREIQVNSLRKVASPSDMIRKGTLEDLLAVDSEGQPRVLNVLDIPMGGAPVPTPPQYRHLASNERAWQMTRHLPDLKHNTAFPNDDMVWGTAATQNATSWPHIDDHGMGTIVKVMAGRKYWVIMRPKDVSNSSSNGDMHSIRAFGQGWETSGSCHTIWDHEGVLLEAGDMLYMRPNTMHYVLTVDNSITYGRHFYASSSMQAAISGIVHAFVMNYAVTNVLHPTLDTMLRRMMAMWALDYDDDRSPNDSRTPHVPNISTVSGLMDTMALGNLMECAQVLDHRFYSKPGKLPFHWMEQQEMATARSRYRKLTARFTSDYVTIVGGRSIWPSSIFRRSLVEFAAAIVVYKQDMTDIAPKVTGCTAITVLEDMIAMFTTNYPELLPCFHRLIEERVEFLHWTGPPITIRTRTANDLPSGDSFDFEDRPIYSAAQPKAMQVEDVAMAYPAQERASEKDVEMGDGEEQDDNEGPSSHPTPPKAGSSRRRNRSPDLDMSTSNVKSNKRSRYRK